MFDWDREEWALASLVLFVVMLFGGGIACSVMESNKYAKLCHDAGGEVITSVDQKLCRNGNTLLNVYKKE